MSDFISALLLRKSELLTLIGEHIYLTLIAILVSVIIGVPLGIFITKHKTTAKITIGLANLVQAVPSLALLGFFIPVLGIGSKPAIVMVVLYSMLPILKNTYTGIININPDILEAAKGIGMTKTQTLKLVKIPLAMPIIMAGIRISAVTAVGLMTIAAFVGAGGLGYLVFLGIQTVDNNAILMGAIPAALLALVMDFITAKIEDSVMPCGIKKPDGTIKTKKNNSKIFNKKGAAILCSILVVAIFASIISSREEKIVVASKNYTEQLLLGNMLADLVENKTDIKVERKMNLGGSKVAFSALLAGEVDILPEYTGVAYVNVLNIKDGNTDADDVLNIVRDRYRSDYDIEFLNPFGFNNTYALAVTKETSEMYNLKTVSDIAEISNNFIISPTIEFANRQDGLIGMNPFYGLNFKSVKPVDGGLRYTALANKESQVIDAFTTDGLIEKMNLVVLEDDKNFFPPYYAAPIIRKDTLEKYPELKDILNSLDGVLTEEIMIKLNYEVDVNGKDPAKVSKDFLVEIGIL